MKAWHVYVGSPDIDGEHLLVFAATRNRARMLAMRKGPWSWDRYEDIRARRAPQWDEFADAERIIEDNRDLPVGALAFYWFSESVIQYIAALEAPTCAKA